MTEFLAENNVCGQNLLRIVSMGNSIIAEILRLKDYIPDVFKLETKADQQKYGDIILDFSYLRIAEAHDKKIENNPALQDLDEEFRDNYIELLTRFYLAFESTHQYASDLKHFVEELNRGYYIQQTLESVLQDAEGKQLMCESLYLFGVILLVLDFHIPGVIRERLLISYYRYSAARNHGDSNIDDVCTLLRSTGFSNQPNSKPVPNYPESYFSRFTFDQTFIDMVIGRLRSDDIYNQISIYPHPDHRSTALSNQAGMLYVCLYFSPKIIHTQIAQMREIRDKFFSDNWVVPVYMGITVNLVDAWDHFKAAKTALTPVVETNSVKGFCLLHKEKLKKVFLQTFEILKVGVLTESFTLQTLTRIIALIRDCNVVLRWFILHTSSPILEISGGKRHKQINELVQTEAEFTPLKIFQLLLNCAQLELIVKEILKDLITEKEQRWENFRKEALDRVNELSEAFSGSRPLSKIEKNESLKQWFADIGKQVTNLKINNPNMSGRTIIQLIQALEDVQEFHNLQSNMQVKQYLQETREFLTSMIQVINIKEDVLINIQLISDLSYAWRTIDSEYTHIMQESIKNQPKLVIKLRATFLKLASALEIPLLRINQAKSEDLASVSKYYSTELANYIRKVVQIIPETMFSILAEIIQMQTSVIKEIPTRLEKDKLKEYAQYEERQIVSKLTFSIAVFTEGILMMKKTLVGVIELDPKKLLEDGIRKELVKNLANALNSGLIFGPKGKTSDLEDKLFQLSKIMDGYRRSFEYIQDYLNIHGLKILQQEMSRIINYNVERECNAFLRSKVLDWQSSYQSATIPIPIFPPVPGDVTSNNFIGRLAREILSNTDPKLTIYVDLKATWYDKKTHKEILDSRFFIKVREAIGPAGLVGLDKLYSYMFVSDLKKNIEKMQTNIANDKMWVETLASLTRELDEKMIVKNPVKFYATYTTRWVKVWPTILEWVLNIGQKQILRQQIAYELNKSCKFNSKNLEASLDALNKSLLIDLQEAQQIEGKPKPEKEILSELNSYLVFSGNYDPMQQVFVLTKNSHNISLFLLLFTISHSMKFQFSKNLNMLMAKSAKEHIDGVAMIIGLQTILNQFHQDVLHLYVEYLCQYVTSLVDANLSAKQEIGLECCIMIRYLEEFIRIGKLPRSLLEEHVPLLVLNQFEYLSSNK